MKKVSFYISVFFTLSFLTACNIDLAGQYITDQSLQIEGVQRRFSFYKPNHLQEKAGLIFVFHGSAGRAIDVRTQTGFEFDAKADKTQNYMVVYPEGYKGYWNDCRTSADYEANTANINDVAFTENMIRFFVEKYRIDPNKVFATGMSNGGHFTLRLALEKPELFKGFAVFSASLPVWSNNDCAISGKPVNKLALFHGTKDPISPFLGGTVAVLGNTSRGAVLSNNDTLEYWKKLHVPTMTYTRVDYSEKDGNAKTKVYENRWEKTDGQSVRQYVLEGSGHHIASQHYCVPILGACAGDISAADELVHYFGFDGYAAL